MRACVTVTACRMRRRNGAPIHSPPPPPHIIPTIGRRRCTPRFLVAVCGLSSARRPVPRAVDCRSPSPPNLPNWTGDQRGESEPSLRFPMTLRGRLVRFVQQALIALLVAVSGGALRGEASPQVTARADIKTNQPPRPSSFYT